MNKRIKLAALLLAMCLLFTGCTTYDNFIDAFKNGKEEVPEELLPVKIGVFEPLTGEFASGAEEEIKGIELAHSLFGVVLGRPIELVYEDNHSDAEAAAAAAQALVNQGVSCVLGSYRNTLSMAGEDIFEENRMPAIAATNTNPLITQINPYYFRVCIVDAFQGNAAAQEIAVNRQSPNAIVMRESGDDYANAMIEQFASEMQELCNNSATVKVIEYPADTEDYLPYLTRAQEYGIESVFLPDDPQTAEKIIHQAYVNDIFFNWIGISSWSELENVARTEAAAREFTDIEYIRGVQYVAYYNAETEEEHEIDRLFKAAFYKQYPDEEPTANIALGFDAYYLAYKSLALADRSDDGQFLAAVIAQTKELEGAAGPITMNEYGDPIKPVSIVSITPAELEPVGDPLANANRSVRE